MRLYMPVSQLNRCFARDKKLGEYDIPQGSIVSVSVFMIKMCINDTFYHTAAQHVITDTDLIYGASILLRSENNGRKSHESLMGRTYITKPMSDSWD